VDIKIEYGTIKAVLSCHKDHIGKQIKKKKRFREIE